VIKPADSAGKDVHPLSKSARSGGEGNSPLLENAQSRLLLATVGSVVLSVILGVRFISPLLYAAAILPFYYAAMRRHLHHLSVALIFRWALTLLCSVIIVGVFVPARMASSIGSTGTVMQQWITDGGHPAAGFRYLLWGTVAFLAGTAVSGGVLGLIIGAIALAGAAANALFLFEHGTNVISISATAVPPWQWCIFISAGLLLVPTALPLFDRLLKPEREAESKEPLRTFMIAGGVGFLLSLVLRFAAADLWQLLLRRFTTF
jgi:hypothetical protein